MKSRNQKSNKGKLVIYKSSKNKIELRVRFKNNNVWLRQNEIAELFGKERSVITKHINKIFEDEEIDKKSNVHFLHIADSDKPVNFYSLDVILSVGYRVNSSRAIHFRQWATKILKNYLIKGYVLNKERLIEVEERFNQLQSTISFLRKKSGAEILKGQEKELLSLLADYSKTLTLLEQYDQNKLKETKGKKAKFILRYENCLKIIIELKKELALKKEAGDLFGVEINHKLESVIKNLYQSFSKKELYKSIEEKAANLLYLIIKDHPFIDGNKRIASFLFIYFLDKNNYLYKENNEKKINDNALIALALLVAESNPKEKDQMVALIAQLIKY